MFLLYNRRNHNPVDSHEAIELAVANNDKSMVPVLIEILRFFRNTGSGDGDQEGHLGHNGPRVEWQPGRMA